MPSSTEAEVVEYVDDMLVHVPLKEKLLVRSLLLLLEVQPLVFNGTAPKLFSKATFEERYRNLKGWEKSSIFQRRLVFMAIRTLLLFAYVDSQEAERDMGVLGGTRATQRRNRAREAARLAFEEFKARESEAAIEQEYETVALELPQQPWENAPAPDSRDPAEEHV